MQRWVLMNEHLLNNGQETLPSREQRRSTKIQIHVFGTYVVCYYMSQTIYSVFYVQPSQQYARDRLYVIHYGHRHVRTYISKCNLYFFARSRKLFPFAFYSTGIRFEQIFFSHQYTLHMHIQLYIFQRIQNREIIIASAHLDHNDIDGSHTSDEISPQLLRCRM